MIERGGIKREKENEREGEKERTREKYMERECAQGNVVLRVRLGGRRRGVRVA